MRQPLRQVVVQTVAVLALVVSGCAEPAKPPNLRTTSTIKDIMDSLVDPSADAIWESISTVITLDAVEKKRPETDEEWLALRRNAIRIVEGANLLTVPGRRVAKPGEKSENPGIELAPEAIQQRIEGDLSQWAKLADRLHDVSLASLKAIEERNVDALFDRGDELDKACESCHKVYWYPDDAAGKRPTVRKGSL